MKRFLWLIVAMMLASAPAARGVSISDPTYRLSVVPGVDGYEPAYRNQDGYGTCWTFGTMSSVESSMIRQGLLPVGTAGMSERDLAWHSGYAPPIDALNGGGSYMFSSAYFARGTGPLTNAQAPYWSDPSGTGGTLLAGTDPYPKPTGDAPTAPYYVRDIEWYHTTTDIKQALITYGAVATCWAVDTGTWLNNATWQPSDPGLGQPNHSVAIVGWDDTWVTAAPQPGAWLIRNSWGTNTQHFGMSYYDYFGGGNDPITRDVGAQNMGAVSFHNVVPNTFQDFYYQNDLGWTNQQPYSDAFNRFTATQDGALSAVSFYTTENEVSYVVRIYEAFIEGQLSQLAAEKSGTIQYEGFHTVDLDSLVPLANGQDFYIELWVSNGWQACDGNVNVTVVTGGTVNPYVTTTANLGESYFFDDETLTWTDLQTLDASANFAIDGLTVAFSNGAVPEPSCLVLLIAAGAVRLRRRRRP